MNPNEKIQLDDITFDDVIAGDGASTVALDEIESPVEEVQEEVEAPTNELEDIQEEDWNSERGVGRCRG